MAKTSVLILLCVVIAPLWGLATEWLFRRLRGDRPSQYVRRRAAKRGGRV